MDRPFNDDEVKFIQTVGGTRNGDKWISILNKLVDYLSDIRTVPVGQDYDKIGIAVIGRRAAGKAIEDELIALLKSGRDEIEKGVNSYR